MINDAWLDAFSNIGSKIDKPGAPPAQKLAMLLKPAFVAEPGRVFVWGDWANIEARVLPWLAASTGAEKKLDIFRAVDKDPKLPDVYMRTAAELTKRDPDELWAAYKNDDKEAASVRQAYGKVPELSLGFGGGLGALMAMATNYGVYLDTETASKVVNSWREANMWARSFWGKHGREGSYGLWGAANSAIEHPDTVWPAGRVAFAYDPRYLGGTLFMALPDGIKLLSYPGIKWEWREVEDKKTKKVEDRYQLTYIKGYGRAAAWYGKFCLAADTIVATSRGWLPIVDVCSDDLLWDGAEWVAHDGLIYQGDKLTMPVNGVHMTPDHEVLTDGGWREAQDCEGLVGAHFRVPDSLETWRTKRARFLRLLGVPLRLRCGARVPVRRLDPLQSTTVSSVMRVPDARLAVETEDARHVAPSRLRGVALHVGPLQAAIASSLEKLRRARHTCLRALGAFREFLGRHGAYVPARLDAGAEQQFEGLRARKLRLGDLFTAGQEQAHEPAYQHAGTSAPGWTTALDPALQMAREPVYDIANAGPRSRFMVMGASGPFVVHNCENATQATAALILKRTLKQLDREHLRRLPLVMHTHDEVITQPAAESEAWARTTLQTFMERNEAWDEGLPLKADITSNWYYSKGKF